MRARVVHLLVASAVITYSTNCLSQGAAAAAMKGFADAISDMADAQIEQNRRAELARRKAEMEQEADARAARAAATAENQRKRQAQLVQQQLLENQRVEGQKRLIEARRVGVTGSGFFVDDRGHIITNAHVVGDYRFVFVRDSSGALFEARRIFTDSRRDLALLMVSRASEGLKIAQSTSAAKGEEVYAVGYPMPGVQGHESKITSGLVNSLSGLRDSQSWMQVSVPIQAGNSGGPLVTSKGEVLGVIVATINAKRILENEGAIAQNVNYAIKSEELLSFLGEVGLRNTSKALSTKSLQFVDSNTVMVIARDSRLGETAVSAPKSDKIATPEQVQASRWKEAQSSTDRQVVENFIAEFPSSKHLAEAKRVAASLRAAEWTQVEQKASPSTDPATQEDLVARAFPEWRQLVKTAEFAKWFRAKPPSIQALSRSPYASDAIAMIALFKAETAGK